LAIGNWQVAPKPITNSRWQLAISIKNQSPITNSNWQLAKPRTKNQKPKSKNQEPTTKNQKGRNKKQLQLPVTSLTA
jgi:hypothetical protein